MNLVQKFVEGESRRIFTDYRKRFDTWLSTVDIDGNGQLDKEQILKDFDHIQDGFQQMVAAASDLAKLAQQYHEKYGKEILDDKSTTT
jgi:hypothetical protein